MKYLLEVCLVALILLGSTICSAVMSDTPIDPSSVAFIGTWTGNANGLPAIKLTIPEDERTIRGDIVFYFQTREDTSHPWHIAGAATGPLFSSHREGKMLTFEVQHHRCDGCAELGPNVKFRIALVRPNEVQLWKFGEGSDSGSGMILARQTDHSGSPPFEMREGTSVELAVTRSAQSMPDADQPDSVIVTLTADGSQYLGIERFAPDALPEKLKTLVADQPNKKLYLKADARSAYVHVQRLLQAIHAAGIGESALLSSQTEGATAETYLPPKGLDVLVGRPVDTSSEPVLVQLFNSKQGRPALKIDDRSVSLTSLASTLARVLNHQTKREVLLRADGQLPFARVVEIVDQCQSAGIKVILDPGHHT